MTGVVHGHAIEQKQVLIGATTTYVNATGAFNTSLYTGQKLDDFQHIGLAKNYGHFLHFLQGNFHHAHLGIVHFVHMVTINGYLVELVGGGAHFDVDSGIGFKVERKKLRFVAHVRYCQLNTAGR